MSEARHTPGPWTVSEQGQVSYQPPMPPGQFVPFQGVAQVYGPGINPAAKANAALIAAAPDLLEVAEQLDEFGEALVAGEWAPGSPTVTELVQRARAALAKAGGE